MISSDEVAIRTSVMGLLVGGKCLELSYLNSVFLSFLAVNGDHGSREREHRASIYGRGREVLMSLCKS